MNPTTKPIDVLKRRKREQTSLERLKRFRELARDGAWRDLDSGERNRLVEDLHAELHYHNHRYYIEDDPLLPDSDYDLELRLLQAIEAAHPELATPTSPTQRVGAEPREEIVKIEHLTPMLSITDAFDDDEVREFEARALRALGREQADWAYAAEAKLDGLAANLIYDDGKLASAATRGNGTVGEDVTKNAAVIPTIPLVLQGDDVPERVEIRGEVVMTKAAFTELNRRLQDEGSDPFVNPRNAAAGGMRQLDPARTKERDLRFYAYGIGRVDGRRFHRHSEVVAALEAWGVPTNPYRPEGVVLPDLDAAIAYFHELAEHRAGLDVEIDGLVLKIDDMDLWDQLGTTARSPRWCVARKFAPEEATTTLERVRFQVGRTGKVTPVAELEPVFVGGVTVANATLHNRDEMHQWGALHAGDTLVVRRAGDVIPEVVRRIREGDGEPIEFPTECPSCGTEIQDVGALQICPNSLGCPAQVRGALIHWASRGAMDIRILGEKTVDALLDEGLVKNVADLYRLAPEDVIDLPLFADKKAQNLIDGIDASRERPLDRFLFALGIRHVGREVARLIAERIDGPTELFAKEAEWFTAIDGIGPEIADSVVDYLAEPENRAMIETLLDPDHGVKPQSIRQERPEGVEPIFDGMKLVFTGSLETLTRDRAKELCRQLGGNPTGSVSKNTDLVVAGPGAGSKLAKAEELGVEVIDEEGFLERVRAAGLDPEA